MAKLIVKQLSTGYYRAQGNGPCEWAQWPSNRGLQDSDFFPEASNAFRRSLYAECADQSRNAGADMIPEGDTDDTGT